jgi:hypothetical protein
MSYRYTVGDVATVLQQAVDSRYITDAQRAQVARLFTATATIRAGQERWRERWDRKYLREDLGQMLGEQARRMNEDLRERAHTCAREGGLPA